MENMGYERKLEKVFCPINSETKCLTILVLGDNGGKIGRNELKRKALELVLEDEVLPSSRTMEGYCQIFEELDLARKGELGYTLTEFGRDILYPIAEFSLYHSYHRRWSLSQFLGRIGSGKTKGPVNAVNMFEKIIKEGPIRKVDLKNHSNAFVYGFLRRIREIEKSDGSIIRLIKYDSFSDYLEYKWVHKGNVDVDFSKSAYKQRRPIVQTVIEELKQSRKYVSNKEIAEITGYHSARVRDILGQLKKDGYVKEKSGWKMTEVQSRIEATQEGREFYREFLEPILDVLKGKSSTSKIREAQYKLGLNDADERKVFDEALRIYNARNGQD
jgi:DNA-binding MarR family transcriptional regulator